MKAMGILAVAVALSAPFGALAQGDRPGYSTVSVQIKGNGKLSPNVDGRQFKNGKFLVITPRPGAGYVFAGWADYFCLMCNTFVVEPGLQIVANFVPNPFPAVAGDYHGLFFESTNSTSLEGAGSVSLRLSSAGKVSGSIYWQGRRIDFSDVGYNTPEAIGGRAVGWGYNIDIYRGSPMDGSFRRVLSGWFHLDFTNPNTLEGSIWNAYFDSSQTLPPTWEAGLSGFRNTFNSRTNPAPYGKAYTFIFPQELPNSDGAGVGWVKIGADGRLTLNGRTVQGDTLAQQTALGLDGQWPLFAPIQQGRGALFGWLRFGPTAYNGPSGKPVLNRMEAGYPVANTMKVTGSPYSPPPSGKLPLSLTNGVMVLTGPHFSQPLTNAFSVSTSGKLSFAGPHRVTLTFNRTTGGFSGNVMQAGSGAKFAFQGVVLQNQNNGAGYYLGPDGQTGWVTISAP